MHITLFLCCFNHYGLEIILFYALYFLYSICFSILPNNNRAPIACLNWNRNGDFLCVGNGNLVKIFDIRKMAEMEVLKGHGNAVNSIKWHPVHESLLLSGDYDGGLAYWVLGHKVFGLVYVDS